MVKHFIQISPVAARRDGFTLLELLIAILILAVIVGIVYGGFSTVTGTMDTARGAAERLRFRQVVWRNVSNNLHGVYVDAACLQPEYQFLGENADGPFGAADSLRFATSLPMMGARALPGVSKVVTYSLLDRNEAGAEVAESLPVDEERPGAILLIREEPLQLESGDFMGRAPDSTEEAYEQAVPVASMDILYFDGSRNEWIEEWDSLSERRLPGGIWVKINFPRSEEERTETMQAGIDLQENPDLEIMVAFPLGRDVEYPFPDFNNLRLTGDEETEKKEE